MRWYVRDNLRVVAFISGGGSTLCSIYEAIKSGELGRVTLAGVIASTRRAKGIENIRKLGYSEDRTHIIHRKQGCGDDEYGDMLLRVLVQCGAHIFGQFGWLPRTPRNVVETLRGINQHPGPLDPGYPDFGGQYMHGLHVHDARLEFAKRVAGQWWTEATAQLVADEYDLGTILGYEEVQIFPDDTPEKLAARVLPVEHKLQIATLRAFAEGTIREWQRPQRLVPSEAVHILNQVKAEAAAKKFD